MVVQVVLLQTMDALEMMVTAYLVIMQVHDGRFYCSKVFTLTLCLLTISI